MKTLLILRHAKSSWKASGLADHDRPLNKRGKRDAPRMGKLVRKEGLVPDLIVCSTARRAQETAEAVSEASGYEGEIQPAPEFYAAGPEAYLEALRRVPDDYRGVMVIGHNPGLEELLELLTDEAEPLSTAALARVALPIKRWKDLSARTRGELMQVWRPRELE